MRCIVKTHLQQLYLYQAIVLSWTIYEIISKPCE